MAVLQLKNNNIKQEITCKSVISIGRGKNNDISLTDKLVSRNHAIVRCLGENDYYLIDEGSANGSYINDRKVIMPTLLQDGDNIEIGTTRITFRQQQHTDTGSGDEADTVLIQPEVEVREFTILVADIRGFTRLSENVPIRTLTEIMNHWFNEATESVTESGGIVDKFLGDCVYARWEMSGDVDNTVVAALTAAARLQHKSDIISSSYAGMPEAIRIGVGIHTGTAALGVDRSHTAIGDAVNVAFRLEGVSKRLGKDIILSSSACASLPPELWQGKTEVINVRGKAEPLEVLGLNFDDLEKLCPPE